MRDINEIIKELQSHPDYCVAEIHTWSDIIEQLNSEIDGSSDVEEEIIVKFEDLTDVQKSNIQEHISYMISDNYNYSSIIPDGLVDEIVKQFNN